MLKKIAKNAIVIYVVDFDVVGYVAFYANDLESRQAFVSLIAVKPEEQNAGIGRKLLEESIKVSRLCGMKKMCLKVDKDNEKAIKFYKSNGFKYLNEDKSQYLMFKFL